MLFAQISDFHVEPAEALTGRFDTGASLARVIASLNALDTKPEFVLATGDLVNYGTTKEYVALREILSALDAPYFVIPGNHDERRALAAAFPDHGYLPRRGDRLCYALEWSGRRFIGLDSVIPGEDRGALGEAQLRWLDAELAAHAALPTVIFLHHPPIKIGVPAFDDIRCADGSGLEQIVRRHPQVRGVLAGHVHRVAMAPFAHTVATIALSTCYAFETSFAGAPPRRRLEPPGFMLHHWPDEGALVSHTMLVAAPEASPSQS
jgi:3',5'-cyclic AMP phosphodiesterase CpdA